MEKIMYGTVYGLSSWWGVPEINECVITKEKDEFVWVKTQQETVKIKKNGNFFNTRQEAIEYAINLIQTEIDKYTSELEKIQNMISEIQGEVNLVQEHFPNIKIIYFGIEKIEEYQEQAMETEKVLDGLHSTMAKVKEKYER